MTNHLCSLPVFQQLLSDGPSQSRVHYEHRTDPTVECTSHLTVSYVALSVI
ncbi:hypothetical protein DPMN_119064 [Dreissena polymorpha]|uniref:Uncharacterized protein n=1 Tax=Dreissena polymorpha TaxID=45954 RepID=A0A9D4GLA7_DREPO|nr:hypothetical protein DPMN_119064 [Dreissena polymorpha]